MSPSSRILFRSIALGVLAMILALGVAGCGKKGPPLPPVQEMIAPPVDLKLSLNGSTAILTWFHGARKGAPPIAGFEIDLATRGGAPTDCQGCPLRFAPLDTTGARTFEFAVEIKPGTSYYFRVRAYTGSGVFSDSSNTVQVVLEK